MDDDLYRMRFSLSDLENSQGAGTGFGVLREKAARLPIQSRDPRVVETLVKTAAGGANADVSFVVAEVLLESGDSHIVSRLIMELTARLHKKVSPGMVSLGDKIDRARRGEESPSGEWLQRAERSYYAALKSTAIWKGDLDRAYERLKDALNRSAAKIDSDALRAVAALEDGPRAIEFVSKEGGEYGPRERGWGTRMLDCSPLRKLAEEELDRRKAT